MGSAFKFRFNTQKLVKLLHYFINKYCNWTFPGTRGAAGRVLESNAFKISFPKFIKLAVLRYFIRDENKIWTFHLSFGTSPKQSVCIQCHIVYSFLCQSHFTHHLIRKTNEYHLLIIENESRNLYFVIFIIFIFTIISGWYLNCDQSVFFIFRNIW